MAAATPSDDDLGPNSERADIDSGGEGTDLPGGEVSDTSSDPVTLKSRDGRLFVQELVRAGLAFSFVILFAVAMILGFVAIGSDSWTHAKEFLELLIPALSALLGSATGFYFASQR